MNTYDLLTPAEVAEIFGVDTRTITAWHRAGKLAAIRTPGGRTLRFRRSEIERALGIQDDEKNA